MTLDRRFLEILVCPATKVPLRMLPADRLTTLNRCLETDGLLYRDGTSVAGPVGEALITEDGKTIYRVDDGVPVLLEDQGIAAHQVPGW